MDILFIHRATPCHLTISFQVVVLLVFSRYSTRIIYWGIVRLYFQFIVLQFFKSSIVNKLLQLTYVLLQIGVAALLNHRQVKFESTEEKVSEWSARARGEIVTKWSAGARRIGKEELVTTTTHLLRTHSRLFDFAIVFNNNNVLTSATL